jgi:hypothetical protein
MDHRCWIWRRPGRLVSGYIDLSLGEFGMNRTVYFILSAILVLTPSLLPAAAGHILDATEAKQADTAALTAEAELFKSIGMGIALSLSQCGEQGTCNPNVSKDELDHLLDTLDTRINDLVSRQEQKQGDYNEVLTAYVNQREAYRGYQADLAKISGGGGPGEEDIGKDTFGETVAPAETKPATTETATVKKPKATPARKQKSEGTGVDLDVFSDVDKPLE